MNVGVLASGRGSNFGALLQKQQEGYFTRARIVCLVSNIATAPALDIAREAGLAAHAVSPKTFATPAHYEVEIIRLLEEHRVEWVVLAGYMKIVGPALLQRYAERMINIHPSLLPAFPGLHGQRQALEYGVRVAGCTAHFVDAGVDTGPIIGQRAVAIEPDDTEASLSARILAEEHQLFPEALKRVTEEPWRIDGRRVVFG